MKFRNLLDKEIDFEVNRQRVKVPAGAHVEIPDRYAYMVKAVGLPLEPVTSDKLALVVSDDKIQALKEDGPTLEKWLEAGQSADSYPPEGYAEVPSKALSKLRAKK